MGRSKTIAAITLVVLLVAGLALVGAGVALANGMDRHSRHAVFVQTNDLSANSIIVYDRAANGMLKESGTFMTGGKGGMAAGSAADPLASQGSLVLAERDRVLLAVNAGSDSVSLFRIARGDKPLLKQVVASGGTFPASIAVHDHLVYVLNAGGEGSVQGYWLFGNHLSKISGSSRTLGLGNADPPNFLSSPGQVGFTPDGHHLVVTTKASTNSILVFDVRRSGGLSATPVVNASATPVPFAFTFDGRGRLVVVEAGRSSLSTYAFDDDTLMNIGSASDGRTAACWVSFARGFYFVSNAGSGDVSTFTLGAGGVPSVVGSPTAVAPGTTDSAATSDQRFLYVEAGGSGELFAYAVNKDGSLTWIQTVTGLPVPYEGIAVN
jgi:6-phosphogluconolactonase (cycloisomerase 2 family)